MRQNWQNGTLVDASRFKKIVNDHLSLGRAALVLEQRDEAGKRLALAVDGLREAGDTVHFCLHFWHAPPSCVRPTPTTT